MSTDQWGFSCYCCSVPWIALKTMPAGYVGVSPWSAANTTAKALSSGVYVWYQVGGNANLWHKS